ncbi:MAG TPA: serine acetyltransferase, partial [Alphaproteobacteria bacterium]|nr:serine acetyltransferase [Alphaproteobacteria bacterium]
PRFHMPHPIGVVIGVSIIGRNAVILPNVCIGLKMPSEKDADDPTKYPQLGDDVFVSTGAVLLGAIKIGNRAIIGANSVVLSNVPDDYVAVGVPAHARAKRVKD